jgi:threonine/homoserine/homoserine lactone efflux protein
MHKMGVRFKNLRPLTNGIKTGLFLQLAVGPVFFFIINLTLQKSVMDGLVAALAVTVVDYLYITLSILGVGKILEKKNAKMIFGVMSAFILAIFGIILCKSAIQGIINTEVQIYSSNLLTSFLSVFTLTITNPMTIIFFTGIFTTKAIQNNYQKGELYEFGIGVGAATFIFMCSSVIVLSLLDGLIPVSMIRILNLIVGLALIVYGIKRLFSLLSKNSK